MRPHRKKKKKLDANQSCGRWLIYVQGCHENCDGSTTSGYGIGRRAQGRNGAVTAHDHLVCPSVIHAAGLCFLLGEEIYLITG